MQQQLILLDGPPQLPRQLQPVRGVVLEVRREHLHACRRLLRPVHRDVRAAKDDAASLPVAGVVRDPDAGGDLDRHPVHLEGLDELRQQSRRHLFGRAPVARDEHGELITAQPGGLLGPASDTRQARSDLHQELVTDIVPQGVVDVLEPVQVHQDHADGSRPGFGGVDPLG